MVAAMQRIPHCLLGFAALALVACGSDDPTAEQPAQPYQRSEQCAAMFQTEPQACTRTGGSIEQPTTALPSDFPAMPSTASYCGGATDAQGTVGLEWAITGLPDDLQRYFASELAGRGYQPTDITHTGIRNCAEAISFTSATHTGFLAFSPGIVSVTISQLPAQ